MADVEAETNRARKTSEEAIEKKDNNIAMLQILETRSKYMKSVVQNYEVITAHQHNSVRKIGEKVDQLDVGKSEKRVVIDFGVTREGGSVHLFSEYDREKVLGRIFALLKKRHCIDKMPSWNHYACVYTGQMNARPARFTTINFVRKEDVTAFVRVVNGKQKHWVTDSQIRGLSMPLEVNKDTGRRLKRSELPFHLMLDCLTHHVHNTKWAMKRNTPENNWLRAQNERHRIYELCSYYDEIRIKETKEVIFRRACQGDRETLQCFVTEATLEIIEKYWVQSVRNYFSLDPDVKSENNGDRFAYKVSRPSSAISQNISVSKSMHVQHKQGKPVCEEFNRLYVYNCKAYNEFRQQMYAVFALHTGDMIFQFVDILDLPDRMRRAPSPDRYEAERSSKRSRLNSSRSASRGRSDQSVGTQSDYESDGSASSRSTDSRRR